MKPRDRRLKPRAPQSLEPPPVPTLHRRLSGAALTLNSLTPKPQTVEADIVSMTVAYFDPLSFGFMLWPNCRMQLCRASLGIIFLWPDSPLQCKPQICGTS